MTIKSMTLSVGLAIALPALSLAAGKTVAPLSVQSFDVLKDLRDEARQAQDDASELSSAAMNDTVSWQTHAAKLEHLREDINTMAAAVKRLEDFGDTAGPIERDALNRALPELKKLAENTTAAIRFLSDTPREFWRTDYQTLVRNIDQESGQLAKSLSQFVHYAKLRSREHQLEKTLSVEAGS